jgi:hypothetical protein
MTPPVPQGATRRVGGNSITGLFAKSLASAKKSGVPDKTVGEMTQDELVAMMTSIASASAENVLHDVEANAIQESGRSATGKAKLKLRSVMRQNNGLIELRRDLAWIVHLSAEENYFPSHIVVGKLAKKVRLISWLSRLCHFSTVSFPASCYMTCFFSVLVGVAANPG